MRLSALGVPRQGGSHVLRGRGEQCGSRGTRHRTVTWWLLNSWVEAVFIKINLFLSVFDTLLMVISYSFSLSGRHNSGAPSTRSRTWSAPVHTNSHGVFGQSFRQFLAMVIYSQWYLNLSAKFGTFTHADHNWCRPSCGVPLQKPAQSAPCTRHLLDF